MAISIMIDEPTPYASIEEWRAFLDRLKTLDQNDENVRLARRRALDRLAELQAREE